MIAVVALALVPALAGAARAHDGGQTGARTHTATAVATSDQPDPPSRPAPAQALAVGRHRWVDLQFAALETRYRFIETSNGATSATQWQHKEGVKAAFKLDAAGRYTIQTMIGTGGSFTGSWDPTGVGTGDPTFNLRVRHLAAMARPLVGLEVSAGSFDALRGESTEITTFDNDAFIEGYRASLKRPAEVFFDELSVTAGYLGDLTTANVFRRLKRLNDHNYTQVLIGKALGRVSLSADWTSLNLVSTFHQAAHVALAGGRVIDGVRLELYQRRDGRTDRGFALAADRTFATRLSVSGGYADIDLDQPPLNGDRFLRGRRLFAASKLALAPRLTLSTFYTRAVRNEVAIANHQRLDVILTYDVVKALQRHGAW